MVCGEADVDARPAVCEEDAVQGHKGCSTVLQRVCLALSDLDLALDASSFWA